MSSPAAPSKFFTPAFLAANPIGSFARSYESLLASACFLPAALIPNEPAGGLEGVLLP